MKVVSFQNHIYDFGNDHQWPSRDSWIFPRQNESHDPADSTYLQYDSNYDEMQFSATKLQSPDEANSPINFKHSLYSVEFTLNPISVTYQRHHINHWILDTLSDLGGFMLFSYLFFSLFCQQIPYRLYYARVLQDTYRDKFTKFLKGIKIKR